MYDKEQAMIKGAVSQWSMTERLKHQRKELSERLRLIDDALAALESSPDIARAVDAIARLGSF